MISVLHHWHNKWHTWLTRHQGYSLQKIKADQKQLHGHRNKVVSLLEKVEEPILSCIFLQKLNFIPQLSKEADSVPQLSSLVRAGCPHQHLESGCPHEMWSDLLSTFFLEMHLSVFVSLLTCFLYEPFCSRLLLYLRLKHKSKLQRNRPDSWQHD